MGDDFGDDYAAELEMMVGQSTDIAAAGQAQLLELEEALSTAATATKPAASGRKKRPRRPPTKRKSAEPAQKLSVQVPSPNGEPRQPTAAGPASRSNRRARRSRWTKTWWGGG